MTEILIALSAVVSASVLAIHHRKSISEFFGETETYPPSRGVHWFMTAWILFSFSGALIGAGVCTALHQSESGSVESSASPAEPDP